MRSIPTRHCRISRNQQLLPHLLVLRRRRIARLDYDSIVVTTTDDVVDPYDGEISLREAVEIYAGSFYYAEIALQDGDVFQANGVTYNVVNGKFYVDNTVPYQVYPGEQFTLADSNVITYVVDVFYNDADQAVNVPDGTVATVNGLECTLSAGVWTLLKKARYTATTPSSRLLHDG